MGRHQGTDSMVWQASGTQPLRSREETCEVTAVTLELVTLLYQWVGTSYTNVAGMDSLDIVGSHMSWVPVSISTPVHHMLSVWWYLPSGMLQRKWSSRFEFLRKSCAAILGCASIHSCLALSITAKAFQQRLSSLNMKEYKISIISILLLSYLSSTK